MTQVVPWQINVPPGLTTGQVDVSHVDLSQP